VAGGTWPLPSPRHDNPRRIGHRGIRELDLNADHRPQPNLLGRGRKSDNTVEAVVVGDGQPGQTQFHGALNQLIRSRGTVEERKMGVAVKFCVGGHTPV
jgi:hypothetical protein